MNYENIDNNPKCQIITLECFLKDHVTLKTGVMMLEIYICLLYLVHIDYTI